MSNGPGITWERTVRAYLEKLGYFVIRSAGSKGVFDLIAWSEDEVLVIQCKKELKKNRYKKDLEQMQSVVIPATWLKQLWVKTNQEIKVYAENEKLLAKMNIRDVNKVIRSD